MNIHVSPQSLKLSELLEKARSLSVAEREIIMDNLKKINISEKSLLEKFQWQNASMPVLMTIWDNDEDSVYDSY